MSKIKVVISGIHYPLSMMSYFIRAFRRRTDVELFLVGPFTGSWIPWNGGMNVSSKYVVSPNVPFSATTIPSGGLPYELVANKIPFDPDLWLEVDAGWHFKTKPKAKVVAHVQTDPHVLKDAYNSHKSLTDIEFCMQTPYMVSGEEWLPYAYDPTVFYPEEAEKEHNGCLIGLLYSHRADLIRKLRSSGFNIYYSIGEIFDENRSRYNKSDIALSWSSLLDLPARVFEGMGMGLPVLTNRLPDLDTMFTEGEHYLGFTDAEQAVRQFVLLMSDDDMRFEIGNNALQEVKEKHTWDIRAEQILRKCGLLNG